MPEIEIKSGQYAVVAIAENPMLFTKGIGDDFVFTVSAPEYRKAAMARQITKEQMVQLFDELSNNGMDEAKESAFLIQLVGGNASETSAEALGTLIKELCEVEKERNSMHIISQSVLKNHRYDAIEYEPEYNQLSPHIVHRSFVSRIESTFDNGLSRGGAQI